jgi:CTP:phosphocholine cytidylyltransferase-like protein
MKSHHFVTICRELAVNPQATQRELAIAGKLSLGSVNSAVKEGLSAKLLEGVSGKLSITQAGQDKLDKYRVKNAIILAAGFGSRCVPLTLETPKGLLKVYGQTMIERQIEQLKAKGIDEIIIVVGYKKEAFDYLIDKYGVKLVYNAEYATKNNLSSLYRVREYLDNSYILMSDFWVEENIFNTYESRSWYSCLDYDEPSPEWYVVANPSGKIKSITIGGNGGLVLIGPAYFSRELSQVFKQLLDEYYRTPGTDDFYWEHILAENLESLPVYVNEQTGNVYEFENLEELRLFDPAYNAESNSRIMQAIARCFNVCESEIRDINPIKEGMTNRSFTFIYNDTKYIMRIPGEGTDMMIDRKQEAASYQAIMPLRISDEIVFIDSESGYKITVFWRDARVCDPHNAEQVQLCMNKLREFHGSGITVPHTFDIFERAEYYESLWLDKQSCFIDHAETKANITSLKAYIDSLDIPHVLAHIDSVPDNFIFVNAGGKEQIRLIDWEYAGMQDAHADIAMFAVYAMYEREQVEALIDAYFLGKCPDDVRVKIYAYIAMCGFLWSNWCEYKKQLGVEFGEYSLRQYRFAKDYYKIFINEKEKLNK